MGLSSAWQYSTCLMREPSALCSWLKLMLSLRAALYNLTGNDTSPKVRCPFQTVDAISDTSNTSMKPARTTEPGTAHKPGTFFLTRGPRLPCAGRRRLLNITQTFPGGFVVAKRILVQA